VVAVVVVAEERKEQKKEVINIGLVSSASKTNILNIFIVNFFSNANSVKTEEHLSLKNELDSIFYLLQIILFFYY
jgi:hypothetical protein